MQVLPGIGDQNAQLDKENAAAGSARTALFQELWQVFLYGGEDLALCIVHRHMTLKERERIVSNDISNAKGGNGPVSISGPSTEIAQVEAKSWLANDTSFEYTRNLRGHFPNKEFLESFGKVLFKYNITILRSPPIELLEVVCSRESYIFAKYTSN